MTLFRNYIFHDKRWSWIMSMAEINSHNFCNMRSQHTCDASFECAVTGLSCQCIIQFVPTFITWVWAEQTFDITYLYLAIYDISLKICNKCNFGPNWLILSTSNDKSVYNMICYIIVPSLDHIHRRDLHWQFYQGTSLF